MFHLLPDSYKEWHFNFNDTFWYANQNWKFNRVDRGKFLVNKFSTIPSTANSDAIRDTGNAALLINIFRGG